jgi:hypothetical protein
MPKVQVYLGAAEMDLLAAEAVRTGVSRSELVRRAIRGQYGEGSVDARLSCLARSAATWRNRNFSGAEYVDMIRADLNERLARLGP